MMQTYLSRQKYLALCEKTAVEKKLTFAKAVKLVGEDPANSDLISKCMVGNRWNGKPPSSTTVRSWNSRLKKEQIKQGKVVSGVLTPPSL